MTDCTTANVTDPERIRLLYDLGCAFAARIELEELLPLVLDNCRSALDAEGVSLLLRCPEHGDLEFAYSAGAAAEISARLQPLRVPADRGIAGAVLRSGSAVRVDDAQTDPRFFPDIDRTTGITTHSLLSVPLNGAQRTIGVLQVVNRRAGGSFSDDDLALLGALAGSVAPAIENARLYASAKAEEGRLRTQVGVLRRDLARRDGFDEIIGTSQAMTSVFRLMESAAASPIAVLIEGETGTGKELVARAIHRTSARVDGPFIAINCAAFPEDLLESELFGHRRGAFTGAFQDKHGMFEAAAGGTLFLDEVGEMPAAMQAKLLRVLQEGEILAVGDTKPRKVDVRIVSATNRNLDVEVARHGFREDLFYRLAAFPIRLPALRERREDIPLIVERILRASAERHRKRIAGIDSNALERLLQFDWPGNVRELENELARAVALAPDDATIALQHLSSKVTTPTCKDSGNEVATTAVDRICGTAKPAAFAADATTAVPLRHARAAFEAGYIADALRCYGGQVTRTAQALGLSRVMLQKKMKEYNLRTRHATATRGDHLTEADSGALDGAEAINSVSVRSSAGFAMCASNRPRQSAADLPLAPNR